MQAARPLAFANMAIPLLVGSALAADVQGGLNLKAIGLALWFGWLDQLTIVFANDVADQDADAQNDAPTFLSGGSRVLVDGRLPPGALKWAAIANALGLVGFSVWQALTLDNWMLVPLALAALGLLWAYSFAPLRLSYRGHGELLQGLGTGVVLVLVGYCFQGAPLDSFRWSALVPMFLLGVAGNILTSLPDFPADRRADKRSYPVRFGQLIARRHLVQIVFAASALTPLVVRDLPTWQWAAIVGACGLALARVLPLLGSADAEQRDECLRFVVGTALAMNLAPVCWIAALAWRLWG